MIAHTQAVNTSSDLQGSNSTGRGLGMLKGTSSQNKILLRLCENLHCQKSMYFKIITGRR